MNAHLFYAPGGRRSVALVFALLLSATAARGDDAPEAAPAELAERAVMQEAVAAQQAIIASYKQHLESMDVSDEQRAAAVELIDSLAEDPYSHEVLITLAMREVNPQFSAALDLLSEEKFAEAETALAELAKSSDPYLAAESTFYLARSQIQGDRYEEALPHLKTLQEKFAEQSLHGPETQYLRGVSEIRVLQRKEASESLQTFLKKYPQASERMKLTAWRMLELLAQTEEGSLRDVQALMEYSRRRLTLEVPDKETQQAQDRAVALLDKLIEKAEEQESQGQGQGQGQKKEQSKSQGNNQAESQNPGQPNQSTSGQGGSNQNDQSPDKIVRELRGGPRTPWDHLRNKQREEKAFAALKAQFPGRYQRLVEQYFRSLQDEEGRDEQR